MGWHIPVSLLAHMIVTSAVSSRMSPSSSFKSITPSPLTLNSVISILGIIDFANKITAECSTEVVIIWRFFGSAFRAEYIAALSDSVPHEVKTISSSFALRNSAT